MGGEILELEVDKIVEKAVEKAVEEAVEKAVEETVADTMISLVRDGLLDPAEGARRANMAQKEFERRVKDF